MAKKKKLNRRAVAVLVILGIVMIGGVTMFVLKKTMRRDPVACARTGDSEMERGNLRQAIRWYQEAVNSTRDLKHPESATYRYKCAHAMLEAVKHGAVTETDRHSFIRSARELLISAVRLNPQYADAQRLLMQMAWGDWPRFLEESQKLLNITPDDDTTLIQRAIAKGQVALSAVSVRADEVAAAVEEFDKAIELKPDEIAYWLEKISFIQRASAEEETIREVYEEAAKRNPDDARIRVAYAGYLQARGRRPEALEWIRNAIDCQSDSPVGYIALSSFYESGKDLDKAHEAAAKAVDIDQGDWLAYRQIARLYRLQNQPQRAADALNKGVEVLAQRLSESKEPAEVSRLQDAMGNLYVQLANMLLDSIATATGQDRENLVEQVTSCREQIMRLRSDSPHQYKIAGMLEYYNRRFMEAVPLLEKALSGLGETADLSALSALNESYIRLGRHNDAEQLIERLTNLPGQARNPTLMLGKARISLLRKDYVSASAQVKEVLAVTPNMPEARRLLGILEVLTGEKNTLAPGTELAIEFLPPLLERYQMLLTQGNTQAARALIEDLHQRMPVQREIIARLIALYTQLHDKDALTALISDANSRDTALGDWVRDSVGLYQEEDPQKRMAMIEARIRREISDPTRQNLELAMSAVSLGLEDQAEEYLKSLDSNHPTVVEMSLNLALRRNQWDKADQWLQRAQALDVDGVGGRQYAALVAAAKDDYETAIKLSEEVVAMKPTDRQPRAALGNYYIMSGDYDKAQRAFESALAIDSSYTPAVVGMVRVSEAQNRQADLRKWVLEASRLTDAQKDPYIQQLLLDIRQAEAKPEELNDLIQQRLARYNRNPGDLRNAAMLANLLERSGDLENAEKLYRHLYDNSANKLHGANPLVVFYARTGRFDDMVALLDELQNSQEDKVAVLVLKGQLLGQLNQVPEAIEALEEASKLDPNDPRPVNDLAMLMVTRQRWNEAITAIGRLLEIEPDNQAAKRTLIRCQIEAGQLEQAGQRISRFLDANPNDVGCLLLDSLLQLRQGDGQKAYETLTRILEIDPDNISARLDRSRLLLLQGEPFRAREDLQKVKSATGDPEIGLQYAEVCRRLGDARAAELAYLEIIRNQREYGRAHVALIQMYLEWENWAAMESRLRIARELFPHDPQYPMLEYRMWSVRNDPNRAVSALARALELAPDNPDIINAHMLALVRAGEFNEAMVVADRYVDNQLLGFAAKAVRARSLAALNRGSEAQSAFQALAGSDVGPRQLDILRRMMVDAYGPSRATRMFNEWLTAKGTANWAQLDALSTMALAASDIDLAVKLLEQALEQVSQPAGKAMLLEKLAMAYYNKKDFANAEKYHLQAMGNATPQDDIYLQIVNNIAYLYANDLQQYEKAVDFAGQAARMMPGNPDVLDTYAWALLKTGRTNEAIEQLQLAIALPRTKGVYHYHLGYAYEAAERYDEALNQYRMGLSLVGNDTSVEKLLLEAADRVSARMSTENGQ